MKKKGSACKSRVTKAPGKGDKPGARPDPPPRIPDHEMVRLIGRGSYGEVWLARNVMGSCRAVKIVYRKSFPEARPFEREFMGIKKFEPVSRTHPGLVSVLHIGMNEKSGYFYYIMEIADDVASGQTIQPERYKVRSLSSDLAMRGRLPLIECLQIGLSLTGALEHLHKRGLIHRDIKPSNIIFVNGVAKLADIGLVTGIGEATSIDGTPGYIAPKDPGTPVADLYSLGKVLYRISTGKACEQFPEPPTRFNELSAGHQFLQFNEILLKACENDPQKRYQSAQEMHAALFQCQHGEKGRHSREPTKPCAASSTSTQAEGERKLLTVLFTNISLTERRDPEEEQRFLQSCFDLIRPLVERYEGIITQFLSNGIMVVFGAPVAREDHCVRAVHAAMAIAPALQVWWQGAKQAAKIHVEVRSGLSTGLAIVGRTKDGSRCTAAGDAVNLASRIANLAGAGEVVVSAETHKTVKDYFFTRERGARKLQGLATPTRLYEVIGAKELLTRIEARTRRGLTPFVGRLRELALLRERLVESRRGRGQIVLLAGEPGVGKSRLLLEFNNSLNRSEERWVAGRSISFGQQIAYLPIIDLLKRLFLIQETDDATTIAARIDASLAALGEDLRFVPPLLKYLLSVESDEEPVSKMDAQQRRIRTFEALRELILRQSRRTPLVLVVEDLHWADKTSEDFLVSLADTAATARVLLLLSYRPEYRNPFPERSYVTRLTLQQLDDDESIELAQRALAGAELPRQLQQLIAAKAEGNPFFVEEIVNSLIETRALQRREGRYQPTRSISAVNVPDTIQDVIMARIDRLEESPRRALQLASVIGREFPVGLLATIADFHEPLAESLQSLKNLEMIYERNLFPEHTCIFKHALTQEVAYNSLLIQRRKELHSLVAAAIEELYSAQLPEYYGLLAYHYERGEEWERALDYLNRAADRSHRAAAYREEAPLLSRAMAIAERLGQPAVLADLRARRGTAWARVGMWAEARPDLETALADLAPDQVEQRAEVLFDLAGVCFWAMDIPGTQRYATEGRAPAEQSGRDDLAGGIMGWLASVETSAGNLQSASDLFERGLARGGGFRGPSLAGYPLTLYLRGHITEAVQRGRESAQMCQALSNTLALTFGHPHLGLALAANGRYREAVQVFEEARQFALKYEVWPFHARAIAMSAGFHLDLFDFAGNEALAEEARERASSGIFEAVVVSATLDLVFNFTRSHNVSRAERLIEEVGPAIAKTGGWHRWLWELRLLQARAELALARNEWDDALRWAGKSVAASHRRGRVKYEVAGLDVRAKTLNALGRKREAISELRKALKLARPVGDPAMFLRASTTLLRIEGDDGLLAEARAAARQILAELPTAEMRQRFEAAEPVRQLTPF